MADDFQDFLQNLDRLLEQAGAFIAAVERLEKILGG